MKSFTIGPLVRNLAAHRWKPGSTRSSSKRRHQTKGTCNPAGLLLGAVHHRGTRTRRQQRTFEPPPSPGSDKPLRGRHRWRSGVEAGVVGCGPGVLSCIGRPCCVWPWASNAGPHAWYTWTLAGLELSQRWAWARARLRPAVPQVIAHEQFICSSSAFKAWSSSQPLCSGASRLWACRVWLLADLTSAGAP